MAGISAFGIGAVLAAGAGLGGGPESGGVPGIGAEMPVTATDLVGKPANNSPQLAVDPTEPRFTVLANRVDAPFDCALQVSGDGGRGWVSVRPVPTLPAGVDRCYAPEVVFDRDGRLYYLFVGLRGRGNTPAGTFITTSSDHARSFSEPRRVLGPERYQVRMALDPEMGRAGRLQLVWLEAGAAPPLGGLPATPNPLMAMHSDDGGSTFSAPVRVSDPDRPRSVAPALTVGSDHRVHVLYYDLQDDSRDYQGLDGPTWQGRWTLVMSTSNDAGAHFEKGVVVDSDLVPPGRVMLIFTMPPASIAADRSGRLFVSWYDARNGDWDVFLRRSLDHGSTWERPVRLNDDGVGNGRHQYLPRLGVSPSGRIDAIFYDRRSNVENLGNDVSYTYSTDAGRSFAPNRRLNGLTFDSRTGPRYAVPSAAGLFEFGSRLALLSEDTRALAAWTDTRNTGRAVKAQDIMSNEVVFGSPAGPAPWVRSLGVLLLIAGAAAMIVGVRGTRRGLTVAGIATLLVSGCAPSSDKALPASPPVIDVAMREFRYDFDATPIHRGRIVLRVANRGKQVHRLALAPLPEDYPPLEAQIHGDDRRYINEVVSTPNLAPAGNDIVAFDAAPGRYAFICFLIDGDGKSHAFKGMAREFRVP